MGANPSYSGEGTIELANSDKKQNGNNFRWAIENGADNFKIDTEAKLAQKLEIGPIVGEEGNPRTVTISGTGNGENSKITTQSPNYNITVEEGSTLKVENVNLEFNVEQAGANCFIVTEGTVDLNNSNLTINSGYGIFLKGENGKLTMNGGKITSSKAPCIGTNNVDTTNSVITVTGATLETKKDEEPAVFLPAKGEATFENCTIKGGTAIEAVGVTTLNLNGETTLKATRPSYKAPSQGSGSESSGSALLIFSRPAVNLPDSMTINIGNQVKFERTDMVTSTGIGDIEIHVAETPGVKTINITGITDKEKVKFSGNYENQSVTVTGIPEN